MAYGSASAGTADWRRSLRTTLSSVKTAGTFACSTGEGVDEDVDEWPLPEVTVEGVGRLALPLSATQATFLLGAGAPAPFGRGPRTVLDPAVRRATQLDASRVSIGPSWTDEQLPDITQDMAEALGLQDVGALGVQARLYKLLLYEPGGHFAVHRDTEKEPGMFGTLLVQLPVAGGHEGGALHIAHQGKQFVWNTSASSRGVGLQFAAFYADCEHELKPITAGLRLVLAYNLVRTAPGSPLRAPAPSASTQAEALAAAVREWEAAVRAAPSDQVVAIPLEHKYTEANLSFEGLKGRDAALVQLLGGCELLDVNLALLTKQVSGGAEGGYDHDRSYYKRGRFKRWGRRGNCYGDGSDEEDEEEEEPRDDGEGATMTDVYDQHVSVKRWISRSGGSVDYSRLGARLHEQLLDGGELFDDGEPDDREYEGFTGNAGPTLEYFYHRAVAVIWPRSCSTTIVCAAGLGAALDTLEQRLQATVPRAGLQQSAAAQQQAQHDAVQLLHAVLPMLERNSAPAAYGYLSMYSSGSDTHEARALRVLTSRPALALLGADCTMAAMRLVARISQSGGLAACGIVQSLAAAAAALADPAFEDAVVSLAAKYAAVQFGYCAQLVTSPAAPPSLRSRAGQILMGTALGPTFANLQPSDVVQLARMVCGSEPYFRAHVAAFSAAVLARQDSQALLSKMLQDPVVAHAATAGEPHVVALVAARVRALEAVAARGAPVFSWAQPHAKLPGYPQVETFLRGPGRQQTFVGIFSGVQHARNWASKYFGGVFGGAGTASGFCAKVEVGGRAKAAYCIIEKTKGLFQQEEKLYAQQLAELAAVRRMLPLTYGSGQAGAVHRGAVPAAILQAGAAPAQVRPAAPAPLVDLTGRMNNQGNQANRGVQGKATESVLVDLTDD